MALRRLVVLLFLVLLGLSAWAQLRTGNLKVRVTFPNGRACTLVVRIQLMASSSNNAVAEAYTNDTGMTEFNNLEIGNYHLIASGQGIETTDSGIFEVTNRRTSQYLYVAVKPVNEADETLVNGPRPPTISAADLNIPKNAAKEFDKGAALMGKEDWNKAIERFNKALAIYPRYAAAYNNLGVVYARMGDRTRERDALRKAVEVNDHFAPAIVNLARMAIVDRDMPKAEALLDKASGVDPEDSMTLILLANVELLNHHYEQSIANCRKAHTLSQGSHALAHYIAGRAFEHENLPSAAASEFQTFLQEETSGERAEAVRKELSALQKLY